jgi:flavorubredoxin
METRVAEVAEDVLQLSTYVDDADFTFNQYLVRAEEPLLFHTGPRQMFPLVQDAVASVLPVETVRWVSFGHLEADECGSMNQWLAAAPEATVAHTAIGVIVSISDLADRAPRPLNDGDVIDLGGRRVRHLTTPQLPHGWDAGLLFEETTGTLFCGDLFTWGGGFDATTDGDLLERASAAEDFFGATVIAPSTGRTIRRLADLDIRTLAPMHAPAREGGATDLLLALAADYDRRLDADRE